MEKFRPAMAGLSLLGIAGGFLINSYLKLPESGRQEVLELSPVVIIVALGLLAYINRFGNPYKDR